MSWQLFYQGHHKVSRLQRWCELVPHARLEWAGGSHDAELLYSSESTGVELSLSLTDGLLAAELHYCRPRFFALEAMPLLMHLADWLEVGVVDMQATELEGCPPTAADLVSSWERSNDWSLATLAHAPRTEAVPQHVLPRERADRWWRWQHSLKPALERRFFDRVFVPSLTPVICPGSTAVYLSLVWTGDAMVVPEILPDVVMCFEGDGVAPLAEVDARGLWEALPEAALRIEGGWQLGPGAAAPLTERLRRSPRYEGFPFFRPIRSSMMLDLDPWQELARHPFTLSTP